MGDCRLSGLCLGGHLCRTDPRHIISRKGKIQDILRSGGNI